MPLPVIVQASGTDTEALEIDDSAEAGFGSSARPVANTVSNNS